MSLFKAPSWARQRPADDDGEQESPRDLFSHSSSFLTIRKEQWEQEKKRKERLKEKEQRHKDKQAEREWRRSMKHDSDDEEVNSTAKKRRITAEDSVKLLAKAGLSGMTGLESSDEEEEQSPVRRSQRNRQAKDELSPTKSGNEPENTGRGGNSEDDLEITGVNARQGAALPSPPPPEEEEDSDPEIAALQRKARENARLKQQQQRQEGVSDVAQGANGETADGIGRQANPAAHDPTIQILITSPIDGTVPLIACRRLSQNLQAVREAWCRKQGFAADFAARIFLTHRGIRLYNVTTVQRLGLRVDAGSGTVFLESDPSKEGVDKVHVEAMTEELFARMKADKARQGKKTAVSSSSSSLLLLAAESEPDADESDQAGTEGTASQQPVQNQRPQQIRLTIQAKDKSEWKVKVTPTTLFSKILKAARQNMKVAEHQDAYLEFDGERLDPDAEVGSTEIEDLDCVEMFLTS